MFILRDLQDGETKLTSGSPIRRLNYNEVTTLKGTVAKALNNSPIGKTYIKDLIERTAFNTGGTIVSTDINELFKVVSKSRGDNPSQGGIWIYRQASSTSNPGNYWAWVGGKGFAETYMAFSGLSFDESKLPADEQSVARYGSLLRHLVDPLRGGMPTIHELMHVAIKGLTKIEGNFYAVGGDKDYAEAAVALAGDENPFYTKAQYPGDAASGYWGERLNQACGYPSHLTHKMTNYVLYKSKTPSEPEMPIQKTLPSTIAKI